MKSVSLKNLLLALILTSTTLWAQNIPNRPSPPRLVNDFAEILSKSEEQRLERFLVDYDDSTSTQIVILTIASTEGEDIILYGNEVGEKWGVGQEGKDNGIVLVVAKDDRKVGISVGYGIEEFQNAAYTKRIIDERILPEFRNNDYFGGIIAGVDGIVSVLSGQFENDNPRKSSNNEKASGFVFFLILLIIIIIVSRRGGRGGRGGRRRGGSDAFWTAYWLGSMGSSSFGRGGSFGGGGGFGGGGFGGFGGGSFGGGGASGSW